MHKILTLLQVFFDINDLCKYFKMVIGLWYYFIVMPLMWIYIHVILPIKLQINFIPLVFSESIVNPMSLLLKNLADFTLKAFGCWTFMEEILIINFLYWSFCWGFPVFLISLWVFSLSFCLICLQESLVAPF